MGKLTARGVESLAKTKGRYGDGQGLFLRVFAPASERLRALKAPPVRQSLVVDTSLRRRSKPELFWL
jgi:hypothetical protein